MALLDQILGNINLSTNRAFSSLNAAFIRLEFSGAAMCGGPTFAQLAFGLLHSSPRCT